MTKRIVISVLTIAAMMAARANADPPERVGRISFLSGAVSFRTNAASAWSPASLNYPVTIGDHLWADRTGRLELEMGATSIDLDSMTAISVLNLDDHIVQLRLLQGSAIARVHELASDESLEIDTPNGAITLLRPGLYRIDVGPNGDATTVTVRSGDTEVAASAEAFPVHVGQSVSVIGLDAPTHTLVAPAPLSEFDDWVMSRDRRVDDDDRAVRPANRGRLRRSRGVRYMARRRRLRTGVGPARAFGMGAVPIRALGVG